MAPGSFVFPEFHPSFDAMFATMKLLESLAREHQALAGGNQLPPYHLIRTQVNCPWEYKGKVMRILSEQYRERSEEPIDGVKIDLGGDGWVLVLPDADRPLFHVLAESRFADAAQALADKYARVVSGLQHDTFRTALRDNTLSGHMPGEMLSGADDDSSPPSLVAPANVR